MKSVIDGIEPKLVWKHFYEISQIPRESGNETAVGDYVISVAKRNNLDYKKDTLGNIIVSKSASKGREDRPMVVIQGHTDMVCEKNAGTEHDFATDPIKLVKDGEWLHADGTTLGADNGIGVCCGLAIMDDPSLEHPAMEFLFTVDEETGLTGAVGLEPGFVKSKMLINLDSEEQGAFYMGCAGGQHTILRKQIEWEDTPENLKAFKIKLGGLKGGHSGMEIIEQLGNSIKLLSRLLYDLKSRINFRLAGFNGGNKHNAIPREAEALILVPEHDAGNLKEFVAAMEAVFKKELKYIDANVFLKITDADPVDKIYSRYFQNSFINLLYAMPHGVMAMSHAVKGLVETSTNMAVSTVKEDKIDLLTSQRSSVATSIEDIANKIRALGELAGFEVEQGGGYPPWQPNPESKLLKLATKTYKEYSGDDPEVKAIHAGLECGIIGDKYAGMDMISFGPTIEGAHSPDERVHIEAVSYCWNYLLELLKKI